MRRDQTTAPEPMRSTLPNTDQPRIPHSEYHYSSVCWCWCVCPNMHHQRWVRSPGHNVVDYFCYVCCVCCVRPQCPARAGRNSKGANVPAQRRGARCIRRGIEMEGVRCALRGCIRRGIEIEGVRCALRGCLRARGCSS